MGLGCGIRGTGKKYERRCGFPAKKWADVNGDNSYLVTIGMEGVQKDQRNWEREVLYRGEGDLLLLHFRRISLKDAVWAYGGH